MTLHAPAWLALLLLAGPILLLHMRRRRRVVVPSLLLWEGLSGERRPSVALQRPQPESIADWVSAAESGSFGVQAQQLAREIGSS